MTQAKCIRITFEDTEEKHKLAETLESLYRKYTEQSKHLSVKLPRK